MHQFLDEVLGPGLHAKRVASLADATLGVMQSASLAVCTIGHGLAMARGLNARHAVKQVDRMLSNPGLEVDQILALWVPYVIGARTSLLVAMDWTDCHVRFQGLRTHNSTRFFFVPVGLARCRQARWRAGTERRLIML